MIELSLHLAIILFVLIAFANFVDSIAGGGGLITIPSYLAVGVPSHLVLGTNKLVSSAGTSLAVYRLLKHHTIDKHFVWWVIGASLIGSFLGAGMSHVLDARKMVYLLLAVVPIMLVLNVWKNRPKHVADQKTYLDARKRLIRGIILCFIVGGYDGFFGPGTGTFLFLGFAYYVAFNIKQSTVYARLLNCASNISALSYFLAIGAIDWKVIVVALPAALTGAWLGTHVVIKGPDKWISWMVIFVLILLLGKSVYSVLL